MMCLFFVSVAPMERKNASAVGRKSRVCDENVSTVGTCDLPVKPGSVFSAGQRGKLLWYHRQEDYQLVISARKGSGQDP